MTDLSRYLAAQEVVLDAVRSELRAGRKRSHWMWFVFPQLAGLGHSSAAQYYAIRSLAEAREYLAHPRLGARLRECCRLLLEHKGQDAASLLGSVDALKLRSCMTLFLQASGEQLFQDVLDAFYQGERDPLTLTRLEAAAAPH